VPHRSKHSDKYDTQRFGHELADLGGASGANSQSFVEDPKLKAELGGQTGIAAIEETIAQYGTAQNAPSWLAAMFGKLKAMFGESVTGSGQLNFEHAIGNEWISGAAGADGQHYKYTDLASALYDFVNAKVANTAPVSAATNAPSGAAAANASTSISSGLSQTPPDTGRDTIEIVARRPIETPAPEVSTNVGLLAAKYGAHERYFNDQRSSRVLAM
jgi:hypothetical protein